MSFRTDVIVRICIITAVFTIISYLLVQREENVQAVPILFVLFGVVVLISVLYDIHRFLGSKPKPRTATER